MHVGKRLLPALCVHDMQVVVDRSVAMGPRKEANPGLREPRKFVVTNAAPWGLIAILLRGAT